MPSATRELADLRAENARLLRLLKLTRAETVAKRVGTGMWGTPDRIRADQGLFP
jgi:hypothetical protein